MQATIKIAKRSTMQEILDAYPSAKRALFSRYHIGGCNSCGYEPGDILEKVVNSHNILDLYDVIAFIERSEQADRQIQISLEDVAVASLNRLRRITRGGQCRTTALRRISQAVRCRRRHAMRQARAKLLNVGSAVVRFGMSIRSFTAASWLGQLRTRTAPVTPLVARRKRHGSKNDRL